MRNAHRFPGVRRALSLLSLAALLGVTSVTLTQCRAVEDNLTGVSASLARGGPGNCLSRCAQEYADMQREEQETHLANMAACEGDPVCIALEKARNTEAKEAIRVGREECFDDCHYQSGGSGGR